jgi:hypothetical protein
MNKPTNKSFCIQCTDIVSGKLGSFIYENNKPFHAISPVFPDCMGLFAYMHNQKLTTGLLADFKVYENEI